MKNVRNISVCPLMESGSDDFELCSEVDLKKSYDICLEDGCFYGDFLCNLFYALGHDYADEMAENIYSDFIRHNRALSQKEMEFFINYTAYKNFKSTKYDSNGKVKSGYDDMKFPKIYLFDDECSDVAFYQSKGGFYPTIFVKNEGFASWLCEEHSSGNGDFVFEIIHTVYHEMVHYKQFYDWYFGLLTKSAFNFISFVFAKMNFSTESFDEYGNNYDFKSLEEEANLNSILAIMDNYTNRLRIFDVSKKEKDRFNFEVSMAYQKLPDSSILLRDEYDIKAIISGVKEDTLLLEEFPQLKVFFESDGSLKGEVELLKDFSNANDEAKEVYYEFLNYLYGLGDYSDVTTLLSDDLKEVKYGIIKKFLIRECEFYDTLEEAYENDYLTRKYKIDSSKVLELIECRKERIRNYEMFFEAYKIGISQDENSQRMAEVEECISLTRDILKLNRLLSCDVMSLNYDKDEKREAKDVLSSDENVPLNQTSKSDDLNEIFSNKDKILPETLLGSRSRHVK